jgi:hypothetical protein
VFPAFFLFVERKRKDRFEVNTRFASAYSNGDFVAMLAVMNEFCDDEIHFIAPNMFVESRGIFPLLTFFILVNETYPDSSIKLVEKRIATIKESKPPSSASPPSSSTPILHTSVSLNSMSSGGSQGSASVGEQKQAAQSPSHPPQPQQPETNTFPTETVEIIDKFTGTRVLERPIVNTFADIIKTGIFSTPNLTLPQILNVIHAKLYSLEQEQPTVVANGFECGKFYEILMETRLTYNLQSNKMIEWTYTILAVHTKS